MNFLEVCTVNDEHLLLNLELVRSVYFLDGEDAVRVEFDRSDYLDFEHEDAQKLICAIRGSMADYAIRETVPDVSVYGITQRTVESSGS